MILNMVSRLMEILENEVVLERPAIYVVATPIGNIDDITLRALKVLKVSDVVICEEYRAGSRLLKSYGIENELLEINEHNEQQTSKELILKILGENLAVAMISDCGTPLFADPGNTFVPLAYQSGIRIIPVPGASSLLAAVMSAGLSSKGFFYYGFLPANRQERILAIRRLPDDVDIIFLEAPYRLKQVLSDLHKHSGGSRQAILCWKLTQPQEQLLAGSLGELLQMSENLGKGEFVLILRKKGTR